MKWAVGIFFSNLLPCSITVSKLLLIFLCVFSCSKEKQEFPLKLGFTLQGSTTIYKLKLVNTSNKTAYSISLFKNNEDEPFLLLDSLPAYSDKEWSRWAYKPKITLADKIIIRYEWNGREIKDILFLARNIRWGDK